MTSDDTAAWDAPPLRSMPVSLPQTAEAASRYFRALCTHLGPDREVSTVLVTHILSDRPPMVKHLNEISSLKLILAKPKSVDDATYRRLRLEGYSIETLTRRQVGDPETVLNVMLNAGIGDQPFAILDIGGYFQPVLGDLYDLFGENFLGVVEDTENGHQRYEAQPHAKVPVVSVARSPLKEPEDHLVGESVVFSMERLIRECGEVMHGRRAVVFGYGKVGRAAARALSVRGVRVSIVETNPVRQVEAQAHGFRALDKQHGLATGDLILGATGKFSLREEDFYHLRNGAFIAAVTSSDDELELSAIHEKFTISRVSNGTTCYETRGKYFYVLNQGNAVNFIDGAVVGPYIYLVQGEIFAALAMLRSRSAERGVVSELGGDVRGRIASMWARAFRGDGIMLPGVI